MTVSLGVGVREPGEPAVSLFKRVDQALYGAKEAGRNCAVWATPTNKET
jgi:PleD family two-component response regulator